MNTITDNLRLAAQRDRCVTAMQWAARPGEMVRANISVIANEQTNTHMTPGLGSNGEEQRGRDGLSDRGGAPTRTKVPFVGGEEASRIVLPNALPAPSVKTEYGTAEDDRRVPSPSSYRGSMICAVWFFLTMLGVGGILFFMAVRAWLKAKGGV